MCTTSSRSMTQPELDCYFQRQFIDSVLAVLKDRREVRFMTQGFKSGKFNLCVVKDNIYDFELSGGPHHFYTYKLSDVISFLEKCWNKGKIIALNGEAEIDPAPHVRANADADVNEEWKDEYEGW